MTVSFSPPLLGRSATHGPEGAAETGLDGRHCSDAAVCDGGRARVPCRRMLRVVDMWLVVVS